MKFFTIGSALLLASAWCQNTSDCGEGKIPSTAKICIEPDYIEGCSTYTSPSECSQCEQGYKFSNNSCDVLQFAERQPKISGCLVRNQKDQTKCSNCANGFIRKQGKCELGIKNCIKYRPDNSCTQCKTNYSLVFNQCRFNTLLGCKKVKPDHSCEQCWTPFVLKKEHCEIPNCQSLNDYGCVTCQCGFYLNKNRTCDKSEDGCLRYEKGRCINCLNHYKLKGGACQIEGCIKYQGNVCLDCKKQYNLVRGGCQFKNCLDWAHDQCFSCKSGYKMEEGVCEKEDPIVCID